VKEARVIIDSPRISSDVSYGPARQHPYGLDMVSIGHLGNSAAARAPVCSANMTHPAARNIQTRLALGGLIALASGMGLGRFLYTPVLPMMVEGAGLSPSRAGLITSANFADYLAGALAASLPEMSPRAWNWLMAALVASAATTTAMVMTDGFWLWVALRFAGGWASAFILVFTAVLVASRLRAAGGVLST
jgi:predicted MFS family arabinose efflux permease